MRIISVKEAIEKGLLCESTCGLCLTNVLNSENLNLEDDEIAKLLQKVNTPSVIVTDDGKKVLSTTVIRESNIGFGFRMQEFEMIAPRVYTSENVPVATEGTTGKGQITLVIQDNKTVDIQDYHISIIGAKGQLDSKENTNNWYRNKLDEPVLLSYNDGVLEVNAKDMPLGKDERLPFINGDNFSEYKYEILLPDGRKSELTYGLSGFNTKEAFCRDVIKKIEKIKLFGGIDPEKINVGAYNGDPQRGAIFYKAQPKEIEIIEDEKYGETHGISEIENVISDRKPADLNRAVADIVANNSEKIEDKPEEDKSYTINE